MLSRPDVGKPTKSDWCFFHCSDVVDLMGAGAGMRSSAEAGAAAGSHAAADVLAGAIVEPATCGTAS